MIYFKRWSRSVNISSVVRVKAHNITEKVFVSGTTTTTLSIDRFTFKCMKSHKSHDLYSAEAYSNEKLIKVNKEYKSHVHYHVYFAS